MVKILPGIVLAVAAMLPSMGTADETDLEILNTHRIRIGLPVLQLDVDLQRIADIRMQINIDRGHWGHHRRFGRLLGPFKPARAEGVGCTSDPEKWCTCFAMTRKYTKAGAARKKVGDKYWQILVLR